MNAMKKLLCYVLVYGFIGGMVGDILHVDGGLTFLAVLAALVLNDARRNLHKWLAEQETKMEERVTEHNRLMNLRHDEGRLDEADRQGDLYNSCSKAAKSYAFWNGMLP